MMERIRRMMGVSGVILIIVVGCGVQAPTAPPVTATASATERPASTSTPTPEPTSTQTPTSTPTPEPTATPEEETLASLEKLFPESCRMKNDQIDVAFSQELMNIAGVEQVSLPPDVLEKARQIILVRWAWKAAQTDDRLSVFKDVDQNDLKAVLDAYDENYDLIKNYPFDFGYGVEGPVKKIVVRVVSAEEWDLVSQVIRGTGLPETRENLPNIGSHSSFFFSKEEGILYFWGDTDNLPERIEKDLKSKDPERVWIVLRGRSLAGPLNMGEYTIGQTGHRHRLNTWGSASGIHTLCQLPIADFTFKK